MMRMSMGRSLLVTCVASALLTLASSHTPATAQSEASRTASQPPRLRLGDAARPVRYRLDLTLNPAEEKFHGAVDIDLEVSRAMPILWLNASGLEIGAAVITCGATSGPARIVPGGAEFVGFSTGGEIEPGPAHLHLEYTGVMAASGARGLFRRREGGDWYIYTQFEPTKARYAVPCFDEPSYKTPWQLTLHVPQSNLALSNTRIISETSEGSAFRRVVFAETPPLPSYLVAAAIGPFDAVDAGRVGAKAVPVRIIALHGRGQEAGYAAEAAPETLRRLEAYFGIPYPYEKLDLVAVPRFWQAMENAGLVTFEQNGLLAPPDRQTIAFRQRLASICAHELSHQWFGDLVTAAWWNDLWLNEGFATWTAAKIVDEWHPEWRSRLSNIVESDEFAKGNDSLVTARSIRQPIETPDDIYNAFDGITYLKGAAVLRMFEQWIGPVYPPDSLTAIFLKLRPHRYGVGG